MIILPVHSRYFVEANLTMAAAALPDLNAFRER